MRDPDWDSVDKAIEFILTHNELHVTGKSMFQPVRIDPETWWGKMHLKPRKKEDLLPNSRDHLEARIKRWKELARNHLKDSIK